MLVTTERHRPKIAANILIHKVNMTNKEMCECEQMKRIFGHQTMVVGIIAQTWEVLSNEAAEGLNDSFNN